MTDTELLELIQSKSPDELSAAELEALRQGIANSAELRDQAVRQMKLEQYLHQALARVQVSADEIIGRAGRTATLGAAGWNRLGVAAAGLIGIALGGLLIWGIATRHAPDVRLERIEIPTADSRAVPAKPGSAKSEQAELSGPSPSDVLLAVAANEHDREPAHVAAVPNADADAATQPWRQTSAVASDSTDPTAEHYRTFDSNRPPSDAEDLKRWFAPVEGHRGTIGLRGIDGSEWGLLEGLWRLKAPLDPGTALRMTALEWHDVQIHAWSGDHGVTLRQSGSPQSGSWAGYTTLRKGTAPIPDRQFLAATDDGRFWRTNGRSPYTLQLRYADGLLTLSHGEIRLLDVPLSVSPTEIYFEGKFTMRELAAQPAAKLPPIRLTTPIVKTLPPASQAWSKPADATGTLTVNADGSVELRAEKNNQPAVAKLSLDRPGIAELVFELQAPQAGTGICLLDAEGNPCYLAGLAHNRIARQVQIGNMDPRWPGVEVPGNIYQHPYSLVAERTWVKLTFASGWVHLWVSVDGRHFASTGDPTPLDKAVSGVGLFASPHPSARAIRLVSFALHELDAINQMAPLALRKRNVELPKATDLIEFQAAVDKIRPADAEPAAWRRACAVRQLALGCTAKLGDDLIEYLWQESAREAMPFERRLALLEQLTMLAPSWNDIHVGQQQLRYYEELGWELARHNDATPYSRIATRQMLTPLASRDRFEYFPAELARHEALSLAIHRQWKPLLTLTRRLAFYHFPNEPGSEDFFLWLNSLTDLPQRNPASTARSVASADWRHPLTTELSKEGFNVLADLRVALESSAYRDACQVIGAANSGGMQGLLPDSEDPDLSVSLAATVALAMDKHPQFRDTMAEQFGSLGRLRVRQAIAARNVEAVEAATLQFYGTEAAAEAHLWLADRAISSGAFAAAQGHYRAARTTAPAEMQPRLLASEQLAAALMGHDTELKTQGPIELGDARIPASELAALADQLRAVRAVENGFGGTPVAEPHIVRLPAPNQFVATERAKFEGEAGREVHYCPRAYEKPLSGRSGLTVDWVAEQMCVLPLEKRVLIGNRFQLASYDPTSGALQWRAGVGHDMERAHAWPLAPMRPLVTSEVAFVRRLRASGPTLAAITLADGSVRWETKLDGEHWVVSDPVLIGSTLYACTARHSDLGFTLSLGTFDPLTGVLLRERTLANLRETWGQIRDCQILPLGESFVITCGGAVLRCNLMGDLRWTRKQLWVPPVVDGGWALQSHRPPTLAENRLLIVQPCVPDVVALDPDNGRLLWRAGLTTAQRILGADKSRVFVSTVDGVEALDMQTGNRLWHYPASLLEGVLFSMTDGPLIATREPTDKQDTFDVALVWLDTNTGQPKHSCRLTGLEHQDPKLGPLWMHQDHLWALYGKSIKVVERNLLELAPK